MFDAPITTLEQAKAFFAAMEGSPYEMAREFPNATVNIKASPYLS